jgi:hypothetical protein
VKGATATFELDDNCPPFAKSKSVEPYLKSYLAIISKIEKSFQKNREALPTPTTLAAKALSFLTVLEPSAAISIHPMSSLTTRAEAFKQFLETLH